MAADPVCGMHVDELEPGLHLRLAERTYWFCSQACLAEFGRHPEDYTAAPQPEEPGGHDV